METGKHGGLLELDEAVLEAVERGGAEEVGDEEFAARFVERLEGDGTGEELVGVGEDLERAEVEDLDEGAGKTRRLLWEVVQTRCDEMMTLREKGREGRVRCGERFAWCRGTS